MRLRFMIVAFSIKHTADINYIDNIIILTLVENFRIHESLVKILHHTQNSSGTRICHPYISKFQTRSVTAACDGRASYASDWQEEVRR